MKYICAQPATLYYAWQIDVMLYSFKETGVKLEDVHIVCAIHNEIHDYFNTLTKKYKQVFFSFYEDTRVDKSYISSIRPHILKKHFKAFPELVNERIFYHDSDIAFTKPLSLEKYMSDDILYVSDTISYIGYDYIMSKGRDVLEKMLEIVGIDEDTVRLNEKNSGGAQYLLKGIDADYWGEVEVDCTRLFKEITQLNTEKVKKDPNHHSLQIWCADMWAVLWNIWKRGKQTKVVDEMDFLWSVTPSSKWNEVSIYHNAGVVDSNSGMFYKGEYMNKFPDLNLDISNDKCSYKYYELVKKAIQ